MTEAQWFECAEPYEMMAVLEGKASDRKLRLFGTACCRRIWPLLLDPRGQKAVETAERYADGLASRRQLARAHAAAAEDSEHPDAEAWDAEGEVEAAVVNWATTAAENVAAKDCWEVFHAAEVAACTLGWHDYSLPFEEIKKREKAVQCQLVRCIFGNPFRGVAVDPSWLSWNSGTVSRLALAIYEERVMPEGTLDLSRLAVLADALEDAGCADDALLTHLRSPGPHIRGCHVLDLILSKDR